MKSTAPDYNTATTQRAAALDALLGFVESIALADDTLDMLGCVRLVELGADQVRRAVVDEARAEGHSWTEIGDALGTTRQGAHERYAR